ncbi:hypothetical protein PENDEC_c017G04621 [Penicillium decumbens]|uniref:Extracellular membrane protein CFEM domain-containing protein n=1 Tax=Penicillium decumbens TaxID=69771 RepID=A0A1V6P811_PENDC|nr:hypothetical protein PENDEC_c017G04621 [Penicillium decumbens]
MKFNILAISTLLALAAAETTTAETATVTLTPEQSCAANCNTTERCCIASCYKVPCPSDSQANDTNKCVAACPQGTGTLADTKKYTECQQKCFDNYFFTTGASATETDSSGTSATSTTGTWATTTSTSGSESSNSDATSTFGYTTSTSTGLSSTNAAANIKLGASSAGLFGLVVAAFAL